MDAAGLLDGLNEAQRRAVTTPVSPLRILAGAGSGKTRVLTRRIAHRVATGDADARRVLAITFTRKAAGELQHRLRGLGLRDSVTAGTFHSVAYGLLRARWADRGVRPPALLDSRYRLVAAVLDGPAGSTTDAVAEIDWAKARRVLPAAYADAAHRHGRRPHLGAERVAEVYDRYEREKRRRRLVDFDDLLWLCAQEIEGDGAYAAAVRWLYRHLFVDEFQDVNPLQLRVLDAWRGDSGDLCVVGDPNQAIYTWNGADASYLLEFEARYPGCETVVLSHSYRSTPEILAVAAAVLPAAAAMVTPTRAEGRLPTVTAHADEHAEALAVARAVRDGHQPGTSWSNQAVLVRTNAQAVLLSQALQRAGIPCRLRGATPFLERPTVRTAIDALGRRGTPLRSWVAALAPDDDDLDALARLAEDYLSEEPAGTARGFTSWLAAAAPEDAGSDPDAVDVVTFHAAKGLEWPTVHVAGLEAGLVPIAHARTAAAEAEERRLLYVAVTRAQRELHCSWAQARQVGRERVERAPSPYLAGITRAIESLAAARQPGDWRAHIAAERALLAGDGSRSVLEPLVQALREWRTAAARAADVPASVIMSDQSIEAVAAAQPGDEDALRALPGIEPLKVAHFAEAVLDVVAKHRPA